MPGQSSMGALVNFPRRAAADDDVSRPRNRQEGCRLNRMVRY
jgi:hypothetical protein